MSKCASCLLTVPSQLLTCSSPVVTRILGTKSPSHLEQWPGNTYVMSNTAQLQPLECAYSENNNHIEKTRNSKDIEKGSQQFPLFVSKDFGSLLNLVTTAFWATPLTDPVQFSLNILLLGLLRNSARQIVPYFCCRLVEGKATTFLNLFELLSRAHALWLT